MLSIMSADKQIDSIAGDGISLKCNLEYLAALVAERGEPLALVDDVSGNEWRAYRMEARSYRVGDAPRKPGHYITVFMSARRGEPVAHHVGASVFWFSPDLEKSEFIPRFSNNIEPVSC